MGRDGSASTVSGEEQVAAYDWNIGWGCLRIGVRYGWGQRRGLRWNEFMNFSEELHPRTWVNVHQISPYDNPLDSIKVTAVKNIRPQEYEDEKYGCYSASWTKDIEFNSRQRQIFIFWKSSRPALGHTKPYVKWAPVASLGVKWPLICI